MARIWKQPYSQVANDRLHLFVPGYRRLDPAEWVYFVHVCSFQFTFTSVGQIVEYLEYYSHRLMPGNRWSDSTSVDHWTRQSRFAKLPLYLWEEPKRRKVVDALTRAVKQFQAGAKRQG